MSELHKHALCKCMVEICQQLELPVVMPLMQGHNIFLPEEVSGINSRKDNIGQRSRFIALLLQKPDSAFETFLKTLESTACNRNLAGSIRKYSK